MTQGKSIKKPSLQFFGFFSHFKNRSNNTLGMALLEQKQYIIVKNERAMTICKYLSNYKVL